MRMEQTGLFDSDGEDGVAGGTLEEMMRMEQDARDALEYEEAMEAHAEAMHEVLSSPFNLLRCILRAFLSILCHFSPLCCKQRVGIAI
jgi:hypothetical protein